MKAVTIHLDDPVYREFQKMARKTKRSTSELIREAMETYRRTFVKKQASLAEACPAASVGQILTPWSGREDLLEDFFDRR
jgi:predicted transcriptional regulator